MNIIWAITRAIWRKKGFDWQKGSLKTGITVSGCLSIIKPFYYADNCKGYLKKAA